MKNFSGLNFDNFYGTFAEDGQHTKDGKDYKKVMKALINEFGKKDCPEYKVWKALEAVLNKNNLTDWLNKMSCYY